MKYRIISKTNSHTKITKYYVQKKVLFWWVTEKKQFGMDVWLDLSFENIEEAEDYVNHISSRDITKIIKEI